MDAAIAACRRECTGGMHEKFGSPQMPMDEYCQ